jgi:uncharacterized membrane protein
VIVATEFIFRDRLWRKCDHGCGRYVTGLFFIVLRDPVPVVDFYLCRECWQRFGRDKLFSREVLRCRSG